VNARNKQPTNDTSRNLAAATAAGGVTVACRHYTASISLSAHNDTMKLLNSSSLLVLIQLFLSVEGGSFFDDVVGKSTQKSNKEHVLNNELLAKAIPLDEYRAKLKNDGLYLPMDNTRQLEDYNQGNIKYYYYNYNGDDDQAQVQYYNRYQNQNQNDDQQGQAGNDDDYYVSNGNYVDFDGYSLKYAKCQPVQRFSAYAVEAGEYSPMVVNDIVILRLCPSYYCSSSRQYGCLYDYAEYAIEMTDYVRVVLRYKMDQQDQLCNWCQNCVAGRRRRAANNDDAAAGDDGYNNQAAGDDAAQQGDDGYAAAAAAGDDAAAAGDDAYTAAQYQDGCEDYESYCLDSNGYSVCDDNSGTDDSVEYMTTEEYLDIIGCTQVNGGYFVRPRCDGYTNTISMGFYHDRFCTWYAGDEVDIDSYGLGIDQSVFDDFSEMNCLDCSQTVRNFLFSLHKFCSVFSLQSILTLSLFSLSPIFFRINHHISTPTRIYATV
jgi:hypothetical protein